MSDFWDVLVGVFFSGYVSYIDVGLRSRELEVVVWFVDKGWGNSFFVKRVC